jgi:hypothetical protein
MTSNRIGLASSANRLKAARQAQSPATPAKPFNSQSQLREMPQLGRNEQISVANQL